METGLTREITLFELPRLAKEVVADLSGRPLASAAVVALVGDLGAGKTTFVQALAAELGVKETVTSPTFVIMKSYDTEHDQFERLVHMDAYRLEDLNEIPPLDLEGLLKQPGNLLCIEWPERLSSLELPLAARLTFSIINEEKRRVVYEKIV